MMDSSKMSQSSIRHKIFDQWPKKTFRESEYSRDNVQQRRKRNQSLRAEEALEKSLLFLNNIKTFLAEMESYEKTHTQNERELNQLLSQLEEINAGHSKKINDDLLTETLGNYYRKIRESARMEKDFQSFSLANLANFDRQNTAMRFTRSDEEAHKALVKKIADLQEKRRRVQETLVGYEYGIPQSQILTDVYWFQKRLENLLVALDQQNTIEFHYLMMYELKKLEELKTRHKKFILYSHENYSRYEGLNDAMNLMKHQGSEMRNDRKKMQKRFQDLTFNNAHEIIPEAIESVPILQKNGHVYQSNMNLFARHSAETNLKQYEERRRIYASELKKYLSTFSKWQQSQKQAAFLYERHKALVEYRKVIQLATKDGQKKQKQTIKKAYLECLGYQIPKELTGLISYKFKVIEEMEKTMKEGKMIIPKRGTEEGTSRDPFRKYFDFFVQIEFKEIPQRIHYIINNKETLNALHYQIKQEFKVLGHTPQTQKYRFGVDYAQLIVDYQQSKDQTTAIYNAQKYAKKRWQALPIGLEPVIFHFIEDLRVKKDFIKYLKKFQQKMNDYGETIRQRFQEISNVQAHVETAEIAYLILEDDAQQRRHPYQNYIRKVSRYSSNLTNEMEEQYWKAAEKAIRRGYEPILTKLNLVNGVQKKNFFTCKILCFITHKGLKISNIDELLEYVIDTFDRNFNNKWSQVHYFIQIVKLRILIDYLENVLSKHRNVQAQVEVVRNILWATLRRYEVNDHLSFSEQDELNEHIRHSLKIYRAYTDYPLKFSKTDNIQLQNQTIELTNNMKKLPLVLGTKAQMQSYESFFELQNLLTSVKELNRQPEEGRIVFLSRVYVTVEQLYSIYINSQKQFQPSDILSVRDNVKEVAYLEKLGEEAQQWLKDTNDQISIIANLYRAQPYDAHEPRNNDDLIGLIKKVEKMGDKKLEQK